MHENQICDIKGCDPSKCRERHPKECKYFAVQKFCKFGNGCGFRHYENHKYVELEQFNLLLEDSKNIKAEIEVLKNTVKALAGIKQEGKVIKKHVESLKDEIRKIHCENMNIIQRIKDIEDDLAEDADEELEEHSINSVRVGKSQLVKLTSEIEGEEEEDRENEEVEELDLFQIEMVNGEMVWACNLRDHGFDSSKEIKEHMKNEHDKVVNIGVTSEDQYSGYVFSNENRREVKEDDGKFTCTLCLDRLDGNQESKEHYIKEHKKYIKNTKPGNKCEYIFCMDIEEDRCSQFCNYYKNMLEL